MPSQEIVSNLCSRFDIIKSGRAVVQKKWEDIEKFVTPYRGDFWRDSKTENSIDWERYGCDYSSVAVVSHQKLSAKIHGAITSPSIRWFTMKFRQTKLNENKAAATWLDECSDLTYYALQDSNFDLEINETYQDLTGFGTASITLEEMPGDARQWNGLLFTGIPLKECFFEQDALGKVARFFREMQMTPVQMLSKFGNAGVPESIIKEAEAGHQGTHTVLYSIYPRSNKIIPIGEKVSPSKMPLETCYILKDANEKSVLGKPGGKYEMPVFMPRWRKTSESVWGNSPGMLAMGDIKSLNRLVQLDLVRGEKDVDPPIAVEERAMIGDLDYNAGGVSMVNNVEGIKEMFPASRIAGTYERIERLEQRIEEYFFVPGLQALLSDNKERTAFEVARMQEEVLQLLGPTMGRIQNDMLNPIVSRAFRMLARDGQLPDPPAIVLDENAEFDIEYLGPLARAMRMEEASNIERFYTFGANLGALVSQMPGVDNPMDNIDGDAAIRRIGRRMGIPAEILRDEADVQDMRDERRAREAAMQEAMIREQQGLAGQAENAAAGVPVE